MTAANVWQELNERFWEVEDDLLEDERARVEDAYREPHRAYHNLRHLQEVLAELERAQVDDPAVWIAALYHDAVYDPQRSTNEEDSVRFMVSGLMAIGAEIDRNVPALILATKDHRASTTAAAALIDADLAILAADPVRYDEYAATIRDEYAFVPAPAYAAGRAKVLAAFLQRERIFSPAFGDVREAQARQNLSRELERL